MLTRFKNFQNYYRNMSVFIQRLNRLTGTNDWIIQEEDYDYHQEVARSSFADMLHDTERNRMYEKALKLAIDTLHSHGKKANVLDIGTGTGLLSMMAARHGADKIVACEAFTPMSNCARRIIEQNGYKDQIRLIPKRSTDLTIGKHDGNDLNERFNILVTEVFDTELIGEGALMTFKHAHENLLVDDCIVVPKSARIYAQVVECPLAQNWNTIKHVYNNDGRLLLEIPERIRNCPGSAAVHDLQLNQLDNFKTLIPPTVVFEFDWSNRKQTEFERCSIKQVRAVDNGCAQMVFMWWDLLMDINDEIVLSCAPYWAHPLKLPKEQLPWRDHWMQAIYYLPKEIYVEKNDEINLISNHDEFSLWFNLVTKRSETELQQKRPICNCGLHVAFSRTRIGQMNDVKRNKKYVQILEKNINNESIVLILGHCFYVSLIAAKLGAKKIYYIESNHLSRKILQEFIDYNRINNQIVIFENFDELSTIKNRINFVFAEPYFITSILPWDNLLFIFILRSIQQNVFVDCKDLKVSPKQIKIRCVAVQFNDLHKIRLPLGECEGFSMDIFDELIKNSSDISDDIVEAQPLWEYPCVALSKIVDLLEINCLQRCSGVDTHCGSIEIKSRYGDCNGIAFWVDWIHDDGHLITTGPTKQPEIGEIIEWDMYTRQGVCLFPPKCTEIIKYQFKIDYIEGNISFKYEL